MYGYQREKVRGRDKLRHWDEHIHTTIYKVDNQQGPTIQHRNYTQHSVMIYMGKESEKDIDICIKRYTYNLTALCRTLETNIANQLYSNILLKKKLKSK